MKNTLPLKKYSFLIILGMFILLNFSGAMAQIIWKGTMNGDWNNAANWSAGIIPNNADVLINPANYNGAGANPIISVNVSNVKKIDVLNGGVLIIQANITATDDVTIDGNTGASRIDMSGGILTIAGGAKDLNVIKDGVLSYSAGSISVSGDINVDEGGQINMTSINTFSGSGKLKIKNKKTTNSSFTMSNGVLIINDDMEIDGNGNTSDPMFNISGGVATIIGQVKWKGNNTDFPKLIVSGGDIVFNNKVRDNGASITIQQSGGAIIFKDDLDMKNNTNDLFQQSGGITTFQNTKTWDIKQGTLNSTGGEIIFDGNTTLKVSTGVFNFFNLTIKVGKAFNQNQALNINVLKDWKNLGGTYTHNNNRVTFNGTDIQTIASADQNFYDVTISNSVVISGDVTLLDNTTVQNTINMLQGNVDLNTNTLTLGISTATKGILTYTSGILYNGNFKRWFNTTTILNGNINGLFPVGTAIDFRPFYVSAPATGPTIGGTVTVAHTGIANSSDVSFMDDLPVEKRSNSYWTVASGNGLSGGNYNLRAEGTGFGQINAVTDLRIILPNGVVGTPGVNAGNVINPQVNRTGLTVGQLTNTFHIGSINGIVSPLPVFLISFTATINKNRTYINWETATEFNTDYFIIERSINAVDFEDIATMTAAGVSLQTKKYSIVDPNPYYGISYYRLTQIDLNGNNHKSGIIKIYNDIRNDYFDAEMVVYPNPVVTGQSLNINFVNINASNEPLLIILLDINGREIISKAMVQNENGILTAIDLTNNISPGIYFVIASSNDKIYRQKIIIRDSANRGGGI